MVLWYNGWMVKKNYEYMFKFLLCQVVFVDVLQFVEFIVCVYIFEWGYLVEMLCFQQMYFFEGQFVVEYEGCIVGYCVIFCIDEVVVLVLYIWVQIIGGGMVLWYKFDGDWLYGMEVVVYLDYCGMCIGQWLYQVCKWLCIDFKLCGIVFGGCILGLVKNIQCYGSVEVYVQVVIEGKCCDFMLSFQFNNDFEMIGLLCVYVFLDYDLFGYVVYLVWCNL